MSKFKNSNTKEIPLTISILIFILVIGTGVAIYFIKNLSTTFLGIYALIFAILIVCNKKIPRNLSGVFRSLIGCLFIFSGFVKGVDPIGFSYKIHDYLEAYGLPWLEQASLILSIIACFVEFTIGIMLLLNIKHKLSISIASIMMLFFTILTLYDAIHYMVPDCGCFGDAIKLSNWQTFYKNLTIDLGLIIVWFSFNKIKPLFYPNAEIGISILLGSLFLCLEIYCLLFLPIMDFRDWKVGNKMTLDNPQPVEYWVNYVNDSTNEEHSMLAKEIPYSDSIWMAHWHFKDQHIVDNNIYPHNLIIFDENGTNITNDLLSNTNPNILIISYSLNDMKMKNLDKIKKIIEYCNKNDYEISFITATAFDEINNFIDNQDIDVMFYNADEIELKSVIRSNPGIIAMKNGIILKKWSNNNIPDNIKLDKYFK